MTVKSDKKIKILLVEDDAFLAELYATKFKLENFEVILAMDGEKALELVQKKVPDIILLDLILPKINGFVVLETLKKGQDTKDIPVILLTNLSQKGDVDRGLAMGAKDYLIKAHFMPSEVVAKIKKIIGLK
ncbi:MAG: response regulator [Candidatus Buchananbacteria bacterium]